MRGNQPLCRPVPSGRAANWVVSKFTMYEGGLNSVLYEIGNLKVAPGTKAKGVLGSVSLVSGPIDTPLIVVRGVEDGPTAVLIAGVHAYEINGIAAIHRIVKELDPTKLKGTVIAVPTVNTIAVQRGDYCAWPDGENLSEMWDKGLKGGPDSTISAQMAGVAWKALERADLIMDFHGNPSPAMAFILSAKDAPPLTHKLTKAFGVTVCLEKEPTNYRPGTRGLRQIMKERNVPSFCPECPDSNLYSELAATVCRRGAFNVFKTMGMIEGELEKQTGIIVIDGDIEVVGRLRATKSGIVRPTLGPGEKVGKGEVIIEILDLYGDVIEQIQMPCTGYCWSFSTGWRQNYTATVTAGDPIGYVFKHAAE